MSFNVETPKAGQNILNRGLPQTGQNPGGFRAGDDNTYHVGWWRGIPWYAIPGRVRFIVKTIGGNAIIYDRATGLMWPKNFDGPGANDGLANTWNNAIDWANALVFAGFSDWRLSNVMSLYSIVKEAGAGPHVWGVAFFANCHEDWYWTSTTYEVNTDYARVIDFATGNINAHDKTLSRRMIAVRKGL